MKRMVTGAYVLVADGKKALVLKNVGTAFEPQLEVVRKRVQEDAPTHDLGTDRPGRMADPGVTPRSAVQDTDWHQLNEDRFDADMTALMDKLAQAGAFEQLIVVAPPKALAEIRKAMPEDLRQHVVAEINKDLTKMPVDKIGQDINKTLEETTG